jgi:hypothetical protein
MQAVAEYASVSINSIYLYILVFVYKSMYMRRKLREQNRQPTFFHIIYLWKSNFPNKVLV